MTKLFDRNVTNLYILKLITTAFLQELTFLLSHLSYLFKFTKFKHNMSYENILEK